MVKIILEAEIKVSKKVHKKKIKEGIKEYSYGSISIDNPELLLYVGKVVKIKIEELKHNKK